MSFQRNERLFSPLPSLEWDNDFNRWVDLSETGSQFGNSQVEYRPLEDNLQGLGGDDMGDEHYVRPADDEEWFVHDLGYGTSPSTADAIQAHEGRANTSFPQGTTSQQTSESQPILTRDYVMYAVDLTAHSLSTFSSYRDVPILPDARKTSSLNTHAHGNVVANEMVRWKRGRDNLAILLSQTQDLAFEEIQKLLEGEGFKLVRRLQNHFESLHREFSDVAKTYIEGLPFFEERLLEVMRVGLVNQELVLPEAYATTDSAQTEDIKASCVLVARSWQLEMLREWSERLESVVRGAGSYVPASA